MILAIISIDLQTFHSHLYLYAVLECTHNNSNRTSVGFDEGLLSKKVKPEYLCTKRTQL